MEKPPQKKQLASGFGKNVRSNHSTDMRDEFAPAVNVRSTLTYDDAVYYFRHFSQQTDKTDNKLKFFFLSHIPIKRRWFVFSALNQLTLRRHGSVHRAVCLLQQQHSLVLVAPTHGGMSGWVDLDLDGCLHTEIVYLYLYLPNTVQTFGNIALLWRKSAVTYFPIFNRVCSRVTFWIETNALYH